jgi:hypothetical protein
MTYLRFFYCAADYYLHFYKQLRYIKQYLEPTLSSFSEVLNYHLNPSQRKKVLRYYPLLTVCALAENYTLLKGRGLTDIERRRITLMSAMATLCDDLLDEDGWNQQGLHDLFGDKMDYGSLPPKAKFILAINEEFKKFNIKPEYWVQLHKAFDGQGDSIRQHHPDLSLEETINISKEKNGNYCLTVATLIDENWTETERSIIYQHGIMGQIANDIYDSYKDTHEGIYTVVRKVKDVDHLRALFLSEAKKMQGLIMQIDAPFKRKKKAMDRYGCIDAFTMVGIDTLAEAEKKYGKPLEWISIPKKDILPDMAKFWSRKRYFKHVLQISKLKN